MFGKKTKKIHELEKRLQELVLQESNFNDSLNYLLRDNTFLKNSSITTYQALMYIQKIICNSIIYNDYAYTVLRNSHSTLNFGLVDFLPRTDTHNFKVKSLFDRSIYLPSSTIPFITFPWSNRRIIDNILTIGKDNRNPFKSTCSNIENIYVYPLGIVLIGASGNHSQLIGVLKGEMKTIKINQIYDISKPLKESVDNHFSNFYGFLRMKDNDFIKDKWIVLMTIGKYLVNNHNFLNQFPKQILNEIKA